jgi:hypothetical protein
MGKRNNNKKSERSIEEIKKILTEQEKELIEAGWTKIDTGVSTMYTRPVSQEVYETLEIIRRARADINRGVSDDSGSS